MAFESRQVEFDPQVEDVGTVVDDTLGSASYGSPEDEGYFNFRATPSGVEAWDPQVHDAGTVAADTLGGEGSVREDDQTRFKGSYYPGGEESWGEQSASPAAAVLAFAAVERP